MQINFLNPILDACNHVLKSVAELQLQVGKPYCRKPNTPVTGKCITGLIGMQGQFRRASMAVVFSDPVLNYIATESLPEGSRIQGGVTIDLVGEISNMILGHAKGKLDEEGYDFEMLLPTMISGYDYLIPHQTKGPILRIPYASSGGPFYVEACFDGPPLSEKEVKSAAFRKANSAVKTDVDVELF